MTKITKFINTTTFIVAILLLSLGVPTALKAEVFTKDGYTVDVEWKYNKKKEIVKAWATVKGGSACNNLETTILLRNGQQIVQLKSVIEDYQPSEEGVAIKPEPQQVKHGKKMMWQAYEVLLECS